MARPSDLVAGVPMVCIPMGRDQDDTAARVVHHGAGVACPPTASAGTIRAAVTKVLEREEYRAVRLPRAMFRPSAESQSCVRARPTARG
jgi:UDP:flavonoid glycosyltransferase YjiC (YdhE family)